MKVDNWRWIRNIEIQVWLKITFLITVKGMNVYIYAYRLRSRIALPQVRKCIFYSLYFSQLLYLQCFQPGGVGNLGLAWVDSSSLVDVLSVISPKSNFLAQESNSFQYCILPYVVRL